MREPNKRDEPTAYRDPGPTMITGGTAPQMADEPGLDRCIRTIVAAVMTLRDCGASDSDIVKAMAAVHLFGPLEIIKRMEAAATAQ